MTDKEKVKAYDEAIDKVAHFIKKHIGFGCMIHPNSSEAKELFNIFPELQKSEDERIRKEIIQYIKDLNKTGNLTSEYSTGWIAWLEKQNHDGKKWIYEDVYLKEKEQLIQDGIDEVLENPQKYGLEKQGEQKEALEHFVRSIGESGYASPYDNNTKLIYSLLEELKKLMDE